MSGKPIDEAVVDSVTDYLCDQEYDIGGRDELREHVAAALAAAQQQGQAVACQHENRHAEYDCVVCDDCGAIRTDGGKEWPVKNAWFASRALAQQPAAVGEAWQVQLADALECFWNPAIEGSGDDRSNIIGGMVQGFAAVAYRLREHAALAAQHQEPKS